GRRPGTGQPGRPLRPGADGHRPPHGPARGRRGDSMSSTDVVVTERHGHVLLVRLNRPERLNAVNRDLARGLGDAIEVAETDPDIRAVVLTGTGRAFCAGADLKASAAGEAINHTEEPYASWWFAG